MPGLGLRFVVGEELDREIRWVHSTDLPDPSAYLSGGELILTGGLWHEGPDSAERFVSALAGADVHALGFGLAAPDAEVPADVVAACRATGLPLVEVPHELPFIAVARAFVDGVEQARQADMRRSLATHEALSSAATGSGGMSEVVRALRSMLTRDLWVLTGPTRAWSSGEQPRHAELASVWEQAARAAAYPAQVRRAEGAAVTVFATAQEPAPSFLVYLEPVGSLSRAERATLEQSIRYVGVELSRHRRLAAETGQRAREFLELVEADLLPADEVDARLGRVPTRPQAPLQAVVLGYEAAPSGAVDALVDVVLQVLGAHGRHGLVVPGTEEAVVFSWPGVEGPAPGREPDRRLPEQLQVVTEQQLRRPVWAGAVTADSDLKLTVTRARRAASYARRRQHGRGVAHYEDLGSHHVLFAVDDSLTATFQDLLLGRVRAYDQRRGSHLVRTLDVFLEANGRHKPAAVALSIHVNSLRYRLRTIERLTGRSLASAADRVDLYLALRMAAGPQVTGTL
jgi:DNA-binding PucR family transcriptional regulator